ncbi:hypothetical protein C8F01DRAFT_1165051 [Mycena amicta]|nr:hypothetical protein C8F01DRAFT_1165051 [Mycena amicta]
MSIASGRCHVSTLVSSCILILNSLYGSPGISLTTLRRMLDQLGVDDYNPAESWSTATKTESLHCTTSTRKECTD